jgi:hypothetical protein
VDVSDVPAWWSDPAVLERIVSGALAKRDWDGLEIALRRLVVVAPRRAGEIVTVMKAGLILRKEMTTDA